MNNLFNLHGDASVYSALDSISLFNKPGRIGAISMKWYDLLHARIQRLGLRWDFYI